MTDAFRLTATAAGKIRRGQGPRSGRVEVTRVDDRVMREALKIAGGDASLLKITGPRRVEIADGRYPR